MPNGSAEGRFGRPRWNPASRMGVAGPGQRTSKYARTKWTMQQSRLERGRPRGPSRPWMLPRNSTNCRLPHSLLRSLGRGAACPFRRATVLFFQDRSLGIYGFSSEEAIAGRKLHDEGVQQHRRGLNIAAAGSSAELGGPR